MHIILLLDLELSQTLPTNVNIPQQLLISPRFSFAENDVFSVAQ